MKPASALTRGQWNDRRGFTLIELMAAMVVVAIGLFAVIQLQLVSIRSSSYARERSDAQEIANGVAEEIMTQSLMWADSWNGANVLIANVFSGLNAITVNTDPNITGVPITIDKVLPLPMYRGKTISAGTGLNGALLINTEGCSTSANTDPVCQSLLGSAGQLYRVYYVAEALPLRRTDPTPNPLQVVRFTVFVSWDNKDHGQSYDWTTFDETTFWNRQMVAVTFSVAKNQLY